MRDMTEMKETEMGEISGKETARISTVAAAVEGATQEMVAVKGTILADGRNLTSVTLNSSEVSLTGKTGTENLLLNNELRQFIFHF